MINSFYLYADRKIAVSSFRNINMYMYIVFLKSSTLAKIIGWGINNDAWIMLIYKLNHSTHIQPFAVFVKWVLYLLSISNTERNSPYVCAC